MSLRQAAEMALEALEEYQSKGAPFWACDGAVDALRAALAEADERPCTCHPDDNPPQPCPKQFALGECRQVAALAEAEEPVAWGYETATGLRLIHWLDRCDIRQLQNDQEAARLYPTGHRVWPLYTHPPRREPLTEDEIIKLGADNGVLPLLHDDTHDELVRIARWVERAHGIGGAE